MQGSFKMIEWARNTNIYEVNVRQYTDEGTFRAFATHLPRLREMGVEVLWFMPITPISQLNRKGSLGSYYACCDYCAINPEFGTLDDFKSLVKGAKLMGFKVIIDWVANHTGWDHVWTKSNPDFYKKDEKGSFRSPFPDWEDTLQLDYTNPQLRNAMISAMKFWLKECDIDGFRCDMAHLVPLDFWKEARLQLEKTKPLFWLAETEDPAYHAVFDATYGWELLHIMEKYSRGEVQMNMIDSILHRYTEKFSSTALRAYFTSNHDENSHSGTEYERMGDAAVPFAVLCATWTNAVPLVYSGQELPVMKQRIKFFDHDPIKWAPTFAMHDFYRRIFFLRKSNAALLAGDEDVRTFRIDTSDNSRIFSFLKKKGDDEVLVILNLSNTATIGKLKGSLLQGDFIDLFTESAETPGPDTVLDLPPWGYKILYK